MSLVLTNNDIGIRSSVGDDVLAIIVAFDDFHFGILLLEIRWNVPKHNCDFIFWMSIDNSIEYCPANVASGSGANITISRRVLESALALRLT